ncbi:hypothetical protein [Stutzerimonas stutzeri]|uniref:hypothetical protein n=1 Tax=Stutzerimonas stutzeri TaxID=316 RepID=UPI0015E3C4F5|nr:hypothetical protein [Stutzerimonas stutzeri]MBA1280235.1 hypothetical protein [Stutzerimonas stutzeri]
MSKQNNVSDALIEDDASNDKAGGDLLTQLQMALDDDFMSDEESEQTIKSHNDALDGGSNAGDACDTNGPEPDDEVDNSEAEADLQGVASVEDPFLEFASARDFMGSGKSFDSVLSELRKPAINDDPSLFAEQALERSSTSNVSEPQGGASGHERVDIGAGQAALMMGGIGLLKLGQLVGKGVGASAGLVGNGAGYVGEQLSRWQVAKAEKDMRSSLTGLADGLGELRSQGLGRLDDKGVDLAERQEMAKQFFSRPGNERLLDDLFETANRLKRQAKVLFEKSAGAGETPDEVMGRVLEPMQRLIAQNEHMLESLKVGDESLLEKMDNAMNGLFDMIKAMFQKLTSSLGIGAPEAKRSGPVMA